MIHPKNNRKETEIQKKKMHQLIMLGHTYRMKLKVSC